VCHCSIPGMGRPLKGRESQKTCLNRRRNPRGLGGSLVKILRIKKGNPRIDLFRSGDFLFSGPGLSQKPNEGDKSDEKMFEFVYLFKLFGFGGI